jgi:hypothetical protein
MNTNTKIFILAFIVNYIFKHPPPSSLGYFNVSNIVLFLLGDATKYSPKFVYGHFWLIVRSCHCLFIFLKVNK